MVAFIDRSHVASDENFQFLEPYNGLTGGAAALDRRAELRAAVEIVGPFHPTGISETASRALIFICEPKAGGRTGEESSCAGRITENLATRAFRRPVTAADMNRLMPFYERARRDGGSFDQGIEQVVAAVLASPQFLYQPGRIIRGPKDAWPPSSLQIWNWLPGFRSSSGARARTKNC